MSRERIEKSDEYKQGYDAYGNGAMYEQCPFPVDSVQRTLWEDGWLDAESIDVCSEFEYGTSWM